MMRVRFNEVALDRLLNSPTGDVGSHMKKIGLRILVGANSMAGQRTGALRKSLYMVHRRAGKYQYVEVGAKVRHAYFHHEGTKPHLILPDNGRILRFNVSGRVVYAKKVAHPGTRPNRFLTTPMRRALR